MKEQLFKCYYHYENIPKFLRKSMRNWFMSHRSEVVKIYNESIDGVNSEWELSGEPYSYGEFLEDVNPAYIKLMQNTMQPLIDGYVNQKMTIFKFKIDEYGDIVGYIPFINNSKMYISLEPVEPTLWEI